MAPCLFVCIKYVDFHLVQAISSYILNSQAVNFTIKCRSRIWYVRGEYSCKWWLTVIIILSEIRLVVPFFNIEFLLIFSTNNVKFHLLCNPKNVNYPIHLTIQETSIIVLDLEAIHKWRTQWCYTPTPPIVQYLPCKSNKFCIDRMKSLTTPPLNAVRHLCTASYSEI